MKFSFGLKLFAGSILMLFASQIQMMAEKGAIIFVKLEGIVRVQKVSNQQFIPAPDIVVGATITEGHTIITEDQSKAILLFSNGSMTTLESNANLTIEQFEQKSFKATDQSMKDLVAEPSSSKTKLKLEEGNLFFKVKTLAATSSFEIDSPIGSAGIRGTAGKMGVKKNPDGTKSGSVNMSEGNVDFKDPSGNTSNVGAGQSANVQVDANGNQVGQTQTDNLTQEQTDELQSQENEANEASSDKSLNAIKKAHKKVNPKAKGLRKKTENDLGEDTVQEVLQESANIINEIFQDATINGDPIPEDRLFDRERLITNEFTIKMIGTAAEYSGNKEIGEAITASVNAGSLNEENSFIGNLTEVLSNSSNLDILGSRNKDIANLFDLTTDDFEAYLGNDVTINTDRFFYWEYDDMPRHEDESSKVYVTNTSAYPGYWNQEYQFISFETGQPIELMFNYETQLYYDPETKNTFTEEDLQLYQENKIVDLSERSTKIFTIAGGDDLFINSDVTFSERGSTWDKEVLAVGAADELTIAEGKTIEYLGNYLGLGAKSTVQLVEATVKAQKGIGVGSLEDVIIQDSHFEVTNGGGFGFFADNLLDINGLTFGGDVGYIYMEARTINLRSVHFPAGSEIDLYSELGPIDGKYPNFGSSIPGRVNFISDVSYGGVENVMSDQSTFDAFGADISILKY